MCWSVLCNVNQPYPYISSLLNLPPKSPTPPARLSQSCSLMYNLGWRKTTSVWTRLTFNSWQPASNATFQPFSSHTVFPSRSHPFTLQTLFLQTSKTFSPSPSHAQRTVIFPNILILRKQACRKTLLQAFISTASYPDLWVTPGAFPPYHGNAAHFSTCAQFSTCALEPIFSHIFLKDIHGYHTSSFLYWSLPSITANTLLSQLCFLLQATALFLVIFLTKLLKELSTFDFSSSFLLF